MTNQTQENSGARYLIIALGIALFLTAVLYSVKHVINNPDGVIPRNGSEPMEQSN